MSGFHMTIAVGVEIPEAQITEICRRYRVRELAVFGSAVRGELRSDSDIDFLVDFCHRPAWVCWNSRP